MLFLLVSGWEGRYIAKAFFEYQRSSIGHCRVPIVPACAVSSCLEGRLVSGELLDSESDDGEARLDSSVV